MNTATRGIEKDGKRCRYERQHQGLQDHHREDPLIENLGLKTDIKNNEFDKADVSCKRWVWSANSLNLPFARHEHSNSTGLSNIEAECLGGHGTRYEFDEKSNYAK